MYTNAGIYRTKEDTVSSGMVLVLSAFADNETILAMPLHVNTHDIGVPVLVGTTLMYIGTFSAFRARVNDLTTAVAVLDTEGIEMVAKSMFSAVYGEAQRISIPRAIMELDYQNEATFNREKETSAVTSRKAGGRHKYMLEDYQFILENYPDNIDGIISKYGLEDKLSVSRLKDYLQRKFKGAALNKGADNLTGERPG